MLTYTINRGVLVTVTQTLTLIMYSVEQTNLHWCVDNLRSTCLIVTPSVRMPTHLSINKVYVITMRTSFSLFSVSSWLNLAMILYSGHVSSFDPYPCATP